MAGTVILEDDQQLRELAKIIHLREAAAIRNINFKSEPELAKYLKDSRANYESVLSLLDAGCELKRKFQTPVAHDISSYIVCCANSALQTVHNYTLRMNYLRKISKHAKDLISALEKVTNVARLAEEAAQYRNAMLEYTRKHQTPASRNFSRLLKEKGLKLEELVQRYQTKLRYDGQFKNLKDEKKLKVYNEIIEASGRGRVTLNKLSKAFKVAGIAVLLFTAGMIVWDIFSSEHVPQTAIHEAVVSAASAGGAMLGEVVGAALATKLVGVEASALFVTMVGVVSGIVGAFILGAFAGWLVDLAFSSGGSGPFSTEGHRCYVAHMPDGKGSGASNCASTQTCKLGLMDCSNLFFVRFELRV